MIIIEVILMILKINIAFMMTWNTQYIIRLNQKTNTGIILNFPNQHMHSNKKQNFVTENENEIHQK